MSPEPGTEVTLVPPTAVKEVVEADEATAGAVTEAKNEAAEKAKAELGQTRVKPFKPPETQEQKEEKTSWIEIELIDAADKPVAGARYRVTLPDGTVDEGTLDGRGLARIEPIEPGQCKVTFPELDEEAWEPL